MSMSICCCGTILQAFTVAQSTKYKMHKLHSKPLPSHKVELCSKFVYCIDARMQHSQSCKAVHSYAHVYIQLLFRFHLIMQLFDDALQAAQTL
jgi:hypothetical protein